MQLNLRLADHTEIPQAHAILVACGEHMHRVLGLSHWYPFIPLGVFQSTVGRKNLYLVEHNSQLVGTFNLTPHPRSYYRLNMWQEPRAPALYFGGFGVLPAYQGQGIGSWCMHQVDRIAEESEHRAVRFDALADYGDLIDFYRRLGYQSRKIARVGDKDLLCFEKVFVHVPKT